MSDPTHKAFSANPERIELLSIEQMRADMASVGATLPVAEDVQVAAANLGHIPSLEFVPAGLLPGRNLLFFHGGGYISGSAETHQGLTAQLAKALASKTWSVDYRLAPERPFPAALDDGICAYLGLLDAGVNAQDILFCGDSAGGGLSVSIALKARELGLPLPAGLILLSPWLDMTCSGESYTTMVADDEVVSRESVELAINSYLGSVDATDPLVSPLLGDLRDFSPMLIQVGSKEMLLSDSIAMADKARLIGTDVVLEVFPEMQHVFQAYYPFLEEANRAIQKIAEWGIKQYSQSPFSGGER